jgi:hypothetical protein
VTALTHPYPFLIDSLPGKTFLKTNATWIQRKAADDELLDVNHNAKPTRVQIQVLTYILNSVGWNNGLWPPTKSLKMEAWWNESAAPPTAPGLLLDQLKGRCQIDAQIRELFELARRLGGTLPCKKYSLLLCNCYS